MCTRRIMARGSQNRVPQDRIYANRTNRRIRIGHNRPRTIMSAMSPNQVNSSVEKTYGSLDLFESLENIHDPLANGVPRKTCTSGVEPDRLRPGGESDSSPGDHWPGKGGTESRQKRSEHLEQAKRVLGGQGLMRDVSPYVERWWC